MTFYDLTKDERAILSATIKKNIGDALSSSVTENITVYFSDEDTYIRKAAYLAIRRIYFEQEHLQATIITLLNDLSQGDDFKIRQTVINV